MGPVALSGSLTTVWQPIGNGLVSPPSVVVAPLSVAELPPMRPISAPTEQSVRINRSSGKDGPISPSGPQPESPAIAVHFPAALNLRYLTAGSSSSRAAVQAATTSCT